VTAKVIITRPMPAAGVSAARLAAGGIDAMVAPLFLLRPATWTAPEKHPQAVMLTSANAPRLSGPLPAPLLALPCYAVGEATAAQARKAGFSRIIVGDADAAALLRRISGDGVGQLLWLAGREHRPPVGPAGLTVDVRIVYETVAFDVLGEATRAVFAADGPAMVLLYSPRAAARFAELADRHGLLRETIAIGCLSHAVAAAAGTGWRAVHIADRPDEDHLFAACGLLCDKPSPGEG